MTLELRPVSESLGMELVGVDLREEQPERVRDVAVEALRDHQLLLVRDQDIDLDQQRRFVRWFGSLSSAGSVESRGGDADTMYIANTREDGVAREGALLKHQDHCFYPEILPGICLYAEEASAEAGETIFASALRAYERLPTKLRERIAGLHARHVYDYTNDYGNRRFRIAQSPEAPTATHPIALEHPRTGRTALFVNELMTDSIVELEADEGEALLQELLEYLDDPAVGHRHRWRKGDVLLWDNFALQHGRTPFPEGARRCLRRLQVEVS